MAQTSLFPSSQGKLESPLPKRSRLSLKQNKPPLHESSLPLTVDEDPAPKNVQDENVSPNLVLSNVVLTESEQIFAPGLPNCGNTCYINSILQVLRYTPNFLSSVHCILGSQVSSSSDNAAKETEFLAKLHKLYIAMKKREILSKNVETDTLDSLLKPVNSLLLSLREVSSLFEEGEQHDAHELLLTILSTFSAFFRSRVGETGGKVVLDDNNTVYKLNSKSGRLKKRRSLVRAECLTQLKSLDPGFEGQIRHCIQCLECEEKLERTELFTNLEVPIADSLVVEDAVELVGCLVQRTMLAGENKYFCDGCQHLNEAQMSSEVVLLPSVLLLHCSWLRQSSNITESEKDCTKVLIPLSLRTSENTEVFCTSVDEKYILYAIVLHLGQSTEGGHYVSFVKDTFAYSGKGQNSKIERCCATSEILDRKLSDRWLLFDDEIVTGVSVNESEKVFPYFDFLGITATPRLIFYYKL